MERLNERVKQIGRVPKLHKEFVSEMKRFLPASIVAETVNELDFWTYLTELIQIEYTRCELYWQNIDFSGMDMV